MKKESWKQRHIAHLKFVYGPKAEKWIKESFINDDRIVYVNVYRMMIEALEALPDEPNNYVCVAMNRKMKEDKQMLDEILDVFRDR